MKWPVFFNYLLKLYLIAIFKILQISFKLKFWKKIENQVFLFIKYDNKKILIKSIFFYSKVF